MLTAAAGSEHLCHAYLLHGPSGVGKRTLAKYIAAAALCTGKDRPCGFCASCLKLEHGNHPDYYVYEGKRGSQAIHIELTRKIRQDAYIKPNDGEYKVYIIPFAEDMSPSAANAFLKVLEEPPAHAIFILTAEHKERVIETIRSRCIQLAVYPALEEEIAAFLKEQKPELSDEACKKLASLSGGSMGKALEMAEEKGEKDELAPAILSAFAAKKEYVLLSTLQKAAASRETFLDTMTQVCAILRSELRARAAKEMPKEGAPNLTLKQAADGVLAVEDAVAAVSSNVNLSLLVMQLTASLLECGR